MLFPLVERLIALRESHPNLHTAEGRAPVEGELLELLTQISGVFGGPPVTAEMLAAADAKVEDAHDKFQA
jgi:hypothetical protein